MQEIHYCHCVLDGWGIATFFMHKFNFMWVKLCLRAWDYHWKSCQNVRISLTWGAKAYVYSSMLIKEYQDSYHAYFNSLIHISVQSTGKDSSVAICLKMMCMCGMRNGVGLLSLNWTVTWTYVYPRHKLKINIGLSVACWVFAVLICIPMLPGFMPRSSLSLLFVAMLALSMFVYMVQYLFRWLSCPNFIIKQERSREKCSL